MIAFNFRDFKKLPFRVETASKTSNRGLMTITFKETLNLDHTTAFDKNGELSHPIKELIF